MNASRRRPCTVMTCSTSAAMPGRLSTTTLGMPGTAQPTAQIGIGPSRSRKDSNRSGPV